MIHLWMAPLLLAYQQRSIQPRLLAVWSTGLRIATSSSVGVLWTASACRSARTEAVACGFDSSETIKKRGGSYQLSFVSLDGDQGSPLSCDNSGCRVDSRRWSATLLSTSWVRFDARGLPKGLPATHMAQGRCWIDADTVSCESHSRNVAGMSAEAQL